MTDARSRSPAGGVKRRPAVWAAGLLAAAAAVAGIAAYSAYLSTTDSAFYSHWGVDPHNLPYDPHADARAELAAGKARAAAEGKVLMVTFGANWCPDCLTLHKDLEDPVTREYAQSRFEIVNVDIGEPDKNVDVAREIGVAVNSIPLAVFFAPDGKPIGDTSGGELEPARHYTSREILHFLREVADYRRVVTPDEHR